jgi:hypothetical protein
MVSSLFSIFSLGFATATAVSLTAPTPVPKGLYIVGMLGGQDTALYHIDDNGKDYKVLAQPGGGLSSWQSWLQEHPPSGSIFYTYPKENSQQAVALTDPSTGSTKMIVLPLNLHTFHWDAANARMLATWLAAAQNGDYVFNIGTVDPVAETVATLHTNITGVYDAYTATSVARFDPLKQVIYVLQSNDKVGTGVIAVDVASGHAAPYGAANATESIHAMYMAGADHGLYAVVMSPRIVSRSPTTIYTFRLVRWTAAGPDRASACTVGNVSGDRIDLIGKDMYRAGATLADDIISVVGPWDSNMGGMPIGTFTLPTADKACAMVTNAFPPAPGWIVAAQNVV